MEAGIERTFGRSPVGTLLIAESYTGDASKEEPGQLQLNGGDIIARRHCDIYYFP